MEGTQIEGEKKQQQAEKLQGGCQEEPVHVMSDDVGRHNIKIYEAFNKFSFAQSRTQD